MKFGVEALLPMQRWCVPTVMLASETDPWMRLERARSWAQLWGARCINLGDVGHINVDAGFGPFPLAKTWAQTLMQRVRREQRWQNAGIHELGFAV